MIQKIEKPIENGPNFIYRPYYVKPVTYNGQQNTDPFVFGKNFYYTCCYQNRNGRSTQLKNLAKGSIILFGSCIDENFVLDTLFVVGDYSILHERNNYNKLQKKVSKTYFDVTILPLYENMENTRTNCNVGTCYPEQESRLYYGVTYEERHKYNGMFSFFPCQQYKENTEGFPRPTIKKPDRINQNFSRYFKYKPFLNNIYESKKLWDEVVTQIKINKLELGIFAKLP